MSVEPSDPDPDPVAAVRRFNRFYTPAIGLLKNGYLETPYTAAEGRALYEIGKGDGVTAKAIGEVTGLDAGYLSRIVTRLERDGVIAREPAANDRRSTLLRLTPHGAEIFEAFDRRSSALVEGLIAGLSSAERARLVEAVETVQDLLGPDKTPTPATLRPHRTGDMGWIIERHGLNYAREYGWNGHIEAVTARICADFLDGYDDALERCWIAERGGERLGCVFLVKDEAPGVARLRLLMLEPAARGLGLGRRLVEECISFSRVAGYREVVLWTHKVLTAARAIYAATGFELEETWTHDDFGAPEISETWRLTL